MKFKLNISFFLLIFGFIILTGFNSFAQKTKATTTTTRDKESKVKPARSKSVIARRKSPSPTWILGIGGNVVDDDGSPFKHLFDVGSRWNLRPYPSRLTVERSLKHTFSVEGAFNFNQYKGSKIINGEVGQSGIFFSADVNLKNDFNKMVNMDGWFNPYVVYGAGLTYRTVRSMPIGANLNVGFGFNIWVSRSFGINFQSIAKFGVSTRFPHSSANYLQHSTGIVYKIQKGGKANFLKRRYKWIHRSSLGRERA